MQICIRKLMDLWMKESTMEKLNSLCWKAETEGGRSQRVCTRSHEIMSKLTLKIGAPPNNGNNPVLLNFYFVSSG